MRKAVFSFCVSLFGINVFSAPVPMDRAAWDGSPIAWSFDAGEKRVEAVGVDVCLLLETNRSARIVLTAKVTPKASRSSNWATFGVGVTDDEKNYWRLSFVQAPPGKDGREGGARLPAPHPPPALVS